MKKKRMNILCSYKQGKRRDVRVQRRNIPESIVPTSRHSRMWKCQRRDFPESPLSQCRDVEIQHREVPERVEI